MKSIKYQDGSEILIGETQYFNLLKDLIISINQGHADLKDEYYVDTSVETAQYQLHKIIRLATEMS